MFSAYNSSYLSKLNRRARATNPSDTPLLEEMRNLSQIIRVAFMVTNPTERTSMKLLIKSPNNNSWGDNVVFKLIIV